MVHRDNGGRYSLYEVIKDRELKFIGDFATKDEAMERVEREGETRPTVDFIINPQYPFKEVVAE